jgi:hypothetical protein
VQCGQMDSWTVWTVGQSRQLDSLDRWTVGTVGQSRQLDSWTVCTVGQSGQLDSVDSWTVGQSVQSVESGQFCVGVRVLDVTCSQHKVQTPCGRCSSNETCSSAYKT